MSTPSEIVRLLEEYGVIPSPLARASFDRLESESPPSLATLLEEYHKAGRITEFLRDALREGRATEVQVGDHLLLEPIGRGGMGMVYRARPRVMQRDVAIKLMRSDLPKDDSALKRFLQEVRTAGELAHPHIVSAFHAGRHGDGYYLTMELVHGETLDRIVRDRGPLGLREALQLAIQVCEGLDYAYRHGFIHRDIKPSNLLLNEQRQVKILDLGLSRRIAERLEERVEGDHAAAGPPPEPVERLTESGSFMGTTLYMSPEQAEEAHSADHRADMYSLGCTLFFMMSGRPPYKHPSPVKLVLAHREAPIPSLRGLRADATPQIDSLFRRILAKKPDHRPDSYAELIRDLRGCLESLRAPTLGLEEVDANSDTMVLPQSALSRRPTSRGLHWVMALIALMLLSVGVWGLGPWNSKPQIPSPIVTPQSATSSYLVKGNTEQFEIIMPQIQSGGTLRLTVRRRPPESHENPNTGPFVVSLPIGQGRVHLSMDRLNKGQHEYFIGFVENEKTGEMKAAERFYPDFVLDMTPKTIEITIQPTGVRLTHEKSVIFTWHGDPRSLRPGQGWTGGVIPYFSCHNDGQFDVTAVEWVEGNEEIDIPPPRLPTDD